jgi:YVTN family beta-propeller protein
MRLAALLVVIVALVALVSSALSDGPGTKTTGPTSASPSGVNVFRVPPPLDPHDVYAADRPGMLSPVVRHFPSRVYVPNSESNTVSVINPGTYKVIGQFSVGALPQHVVPSYDLKTLWVNNDDGNSLTPINPANGRPGRPVPVTDPYNLYFTPDGRYAIVVEERMQTLAFRDAHTMRLYHSISIPCSGVNHMDFTADGRYLLASCEFDGKVVKVDVSREKVVGTLTLDPGGMPQDVKLSPDGKDFYVADMAAGGVWIVDAQSFRKVGFIRTGAGAHGLYVSRDSKYLYVSDRSAGEVSVISFATRKVVHTWRIPGGSPDMGGVSADGKVLWLSGRYGGEVYAISTQNGHLLARIPVGSGPHGLCVYPQPGRYSLGHTGVFR